MSLSPRAIATLGIGYGPRLTAALGLWPIAAEPEPQPSAWAAQGLGPVRIQKRKRRQDEDILILFDD